MSPIDVLQAIEVTLLPLFFVLGIGLIKGKKAAGIALMFYVVVRFSIAMRELL